MAAHGSIWPLVLAGGLTMIAFGVVTYPLFAFVGAALFAGALVGWVREVVLHG
jgi:hypothetical protein